MNFGKLFNILLGKPAAKQAAKAVAKAIGQAAETAANKQIAATIAKRPEMKGLGAAAEKLAAKKIAELLNQPSAPSKPRINFETLPDDVLNEVAKQRRADQRRQTREGTSPGLKGLPGWNKTPEPEPQPDYGPAVDQHDMDLLKGTMYEVRSSNVHSIGMRTDQVGANTGTLLIRYLATQQGGVRSGPGSLYGYFDVPVTLFLELQHAASKGIFLWDHVRVRGTISGHRYVYELLGINSQYAGGTMHENYVPRQAAILRGNAGEHYIQRTHTIYVDAPDWRKQQAVHIKSQLTPEQARLRGPNPSRGPGVQALRLWPNRQGGMDGMQGGRQ